MTVTPVARLARCPASAPALAWPGGAMDYGRLRARVAALAGEAAGRGAPDSPVAIISGSRINVALGVLAALRLGRPALPLDAARPDLEACLAACAPGAVLGDEAFAAAAAPPGATTRTLTRPAASARRCALLVATSGTHGPARVAMLSAAALDAHVAASAAVLPPLAAGDRWLVCLPMTSIGALAALWRTLSAGACLVLLERFDAESARREMAAGVSHASVVPAMLAPLCSVAAPPPRGLRCLLSGGGALSARGADAARACGWPHWHGWGMTETASHVAVGLVDADWREGIVGRPLPGVALAVDDARGRITIGGPMLMSGYASPGLAPGAGLLPDGRLLSGDLGEWLADGRLRMLGRADDVIVTGGVNVHPEAVEEALGPCPDVGEVAVTARPDVRWGTVLVALYTGPTEPAALEAWARKHLPSASRPRLFRRVPALPRNAMGKLLRGELPALLVGEDS
ncbi:MAG TPA: AMP-binding protein [Gammaproteobacteria bacterium]|nr:AMP-binding protein [Gammaproteobacteria bacterium]